MNKLDRFLNVLILCVIGVFGGGIYLDYVSYQKDPAAFEAAQGMSFNDRAMSQLVMGAVVIIIVLAVKYVRARKK